MDLPVQARDIWGLLAKGAVGLQGLKRDSGDTCQGLKRIIAVS